MSVNINSIPEPFRDFLGSDGNKVEQEIAATNIESQIAGKSQIAGERNRSDMQDLLFLAAILMLCDD